MRIPRLENLSLRQRVAIAIAIVVGALLFLIILSRLFGSESGAEPVVHPSKYDARLLELDRMAVDAAYQEDIKQLFLVWMKDATDQPKRAIGGARKAKAAYIGAMTEIDKREPNAR